MRVGKHADALLHFARCLASVEAVDAGVAGVLLEHGVENTERRCFARTVRSEKTGDLSVFGFEADAVERAHIAEGFLDVDELDHGSGPAKEVKKDIGWMSSTQAVSSASWRPTSTNSAARPEMHPRWTTMCPCPGAMR